MEKDLKVSDKVIYNIVDASYRDANWKYVIEQSEHEWTIVKVDEDEKEIETDNGLIFWFDEVRKK